MRGHEKLGQKICILVKHLIWGQRGRSTIVFIVVWISLATFKKRMRKNCVSIGTWGQKQVWVSEVEAVYFGTRSLLKTGWYARSLLQICSGLGLKSCPPQMTVSEWVWPWTKRTFFLTFWETSQHFHTLGCYCGSSLTQVCYLGPSFCFRTTEIQVRHWSYSENDDLSDFTTALKKHTRTRRKKVKRQIGTRIADGKKPRGIEKCEPIEFHLSEGGV